MLNDFIVRHNPTFSDFMEIYVLTNVVWRFFPDIVRKFFPNVVRNFFPNEVQKLHQKWQS
jgi:hypothetical protein